MKTKTSRLLAMLLAVIMVMGLFPTTALALEQGDANSLTEKYINEADGREIAAAQTSKTTEVKDPQTIVGYEYESFSVVTENIYAKEDLTYIQGYPDKTVRGERYLSRAEAATIFYRLYDGYYPTLQRQMTSTTFSDVSTGAWYYTEVELAYNVGIINGYEDGTFKPDDPITRAEFAMIAALFAELSRSEQTMFNDVTSDHWAFQLINAAAIAGWVQGYGDGTYRPEETISRSEAVTLINRMRNRIITAEELNELGVQNPYTDLVETYWAYGDLLEATIKHAASDWHDLTYNDGNLNIIIERYVDADGNEIAGATTSQGAENYAARQFDRHYYLGYITEITCVYSDGAARMTGTKTADKSTASVGDTLTYTITAGNAKAATATLENVVMTDVIPDYLTFVYGSVQVDGVSAKYSYNTETKQLTVELGDIAPGESKTVTFAAVINKSAYGAEFKNVAVLSADNSSDKSVTDEGVTVDDGTAKMSAAKSASKSTASVGDSLTYTITASNAETATASLENVVMSDTISDYLTFTHGSVQVDGKTAKYSYDSGGKRLTVELGDIAAGQTVTVTFEAVINSTAYGKSFHNVAVLSADNAADETVIDEGVTVEKGTAGMSAAKSVSQSTAKVGDTLTYTITATNKETATANLENVVMTDVLSEYVTFAYGSVQVDGYFAKYSYDNESRQLSVELGDIAAGQTKTITFSCVVNSTAYGKEFTNTAVLSADNDDDKTVTDKGVTVDDGTAEGSVGAKTVSSPTASVGDTLTYTITLRNASTATAAWTGIEITDVIPKYLSFVSGSVEEDGRASTNFSYNANTGTLTLYADSIGAGETKTFTFKVTVQDGAQGMYLVNTAVVSSDDREDIQLPDTGVQVDSGDIAPYMTKTASVSEAYAGDIFSYTVTVKNGIDATAAWQNVVLTDVLPDGVKLVSGSVTLNGQTVAYGIAGQAIEVTIGTLSAGAEAVVSFEVRVLDSAIGTTITNVATAEGDNGKKTATDSGVTVPAPTDNDAEDDENSVTGTKTVDKTIVNTGDKVTYTITAKNNTEETWTGVQIYDVLDTSILTLIDDTIYIDGIRYLSGSGKWSFTDRQLVINLGDIDAGKEVKVSFTVQFKNDAANSSYTNHATIKSTSHDSVYVKAPEVVIMAGGGKEFDAYTEVHYKLFIGFPDGEWKPSENISLNNMCILGYRLMTDYYRSTLGNGTITVPDGITDREVQFFISHGIISASEYSNGTDATQSQIYRILNYAIGAGLSSNSSAGMSRTSVATLICELTGRDTNPNTNGLYVAYFPDKGSYVGLIDEVSNSHDYTLDSSGNETWISILND
ncbi:MAG: DUF11 domain-containing protein [Oscillospiraceae bacterium]|nr:DUF11 domain-containing protein [Oscillospiraceae bacterium]